MTDHIVVPRNTKRTLVISAGVFLAVNLFVIGMFATRNTTSTSDLPSAVKELFPPRDQVIRAQEQVGVRLDPNWTGELTLDDSALPLDEYEQQGIEIGYVFWKPGNAKTFAELKPGSHKLVLHYWPKTEGPGGTNDSVYSWTFKSA